MRLSVVLAVRALNIGGAERQFLELVKKIDRDRFDVHVLTLRAGALDDDVRALAGVDFVCLNQGGRWDLDFLRRFLQAQRRIRPDVLYSFMFDMNVYAALVLKAARVRPRLVWGIFGSEPDFARGPRFLRSFFFLLKRLESSADLITSDSERGFVFLRKYGFRLRNSRVIFSGTDTERFRRRADLRRAFRAEHALGEGDIAIGINSRLVHMKGYPVLARAARRVLLERPDVRFFAIGYGDDSIRRDCVRILSDAGGRFVWLGKQREPERILSGWDLYCSSSVYGEGFSNSIIEAMASELPCVVTDVGDARIQVGDTGLLVEPGDDEQLYRALMEMISHPRRAALGAAARARVLERFSAQRMVADTEDALLRLAARAPWSRRGQAAAAASAGHTYGAHDLS